MMIQSVDLTYGIFRFVVTSILLTVAEHTSFSFKDHVGEDGTLVPLIFYADATSITRFKNKSFHPVVMRIATMERSIRNSYERGGGTLIGYIPSLSIYDQ